MQLYTLPHVVGLDLAGWSSSAQCCSTNATDSFFGKRPVRSAGSPHQDFVRYPLDGTHRCMGSDIYPHTTSSCSGDNASRAIFGGQCQSSAVSSLSCTGVAMMRLMLPLGGSKIVHPSGCILTLMADIPMVQSG